MSATAKVAVKPTRNYSDERRERLFECEVGDLLASLRRVQVALKKADADIGFLAGTAATARLVVIDGPEFVCSTPLGFEIPESFVVRKSLLLKTLSTFKADQLQAKLRLDLVRSAGVITYLRCSIGQGTQGYSGTFAVVPNEGARYEELLAKLSEEHGNPLVLQVSQPAFFASLLRVLPPAKVKFSADLSNVFIELGEKGMFMSAASNTFAARFCVAAQRLAPGVFPIAVGDMEVIADGIKDQVVSSDENIEIRFTLGQISVRCGKIAYTVRCTTGKLPPLDRLITEQTLKWGVTLPRCAVEVVMSGINTMSDDKSPNFGFRFDNDEGVMMRAIGTCDGEMEIELAGAIMVGAMPPNMMFKAEILTKTMAVVPTTETIHLMGYGEVQHVHVKDPSTSGVVIMMPAMV
ncbi:hypothetical protein [Nevskia ramosa]|uniref:hypothetical protein n=1 Tax=Nevskia ramosa TaxID=64002 RepID=UPI0023527C6F|nr:hypothetical protein [Nevskia ramosa]